MGSRFFKVLGLLPFWRHTETQLCEVVFLAFPNIMYVFSYFAFLLIHIIKEWNEAWILSLE
jgi:hypothetical protein